MGVSTSFSLEYSGFNAEVPAGLAALVEAECAAKTRKSRANLGFTADYLVSEGSLGRKRNRRDGEEAPAEEAVPEVAAGNATEVVAEEPAEKKNFVINVDFNISGRSTKNFGWSNQELAKSLMKDCVGSVLADFEGNVGVEDMDGTSGVGLSKPEDMEEEFWPSWDLAGSGCLDGSVLIGGNLQEKLECQACPRGTVFVSRAKGTKTMCRPCPAGTYMDQEGATHNKAGEAGECNACPSDAFMTNVFPAYTSDQCAKSKSTTNSTFIIDDSK